MEDRVLSRQHARDIVRLVGTKILTYPTDTCTFCCAAPVVDVSDMVTDTYTQ